MSGLLAKLGLQPPAAKRAGAAAPAPAAQPGARGTIPAAALERWRKERGTVVQHLRGLAQQASKSSHAKAREAFVEIQAVVKNLEANPTSTLQLDELERWLREDDVVGDIDSLGVKVRQPLLQALADARASA